MYHEANPFITCRRSGADPLGLWRRVRQFLPPAPPNSSPGNTGSGPNGDDAGKPTLPPSPGTGDYPPAPPGHTGKLRPVEKHHVLGLFWNLDRGLSNPYSLLHMLAPISDLRL